MLQILSLQFQLPKLTENFIANSRLDQLIKTKWHKILHRIKWITLLPYIIVYWSSLSEHMYITMLYLHRPGVLEFPLLLFNNLVCLIASLEIPDMIVPSVVDDSHIFQLKNDGDVFQVLSPNFPENYPDNQNISYWFRGNGKAIMIKSEAMNLQALEPSGVCAKDYLVFWDLQYPWSILRTACGNALFQVNSYSDSVMMLFITDSSQNFKGFNLTLKAINESKYCGEGDLRCVSANKDEPLCLHNDRICDGIQQCAGGEDEICTQECGIPQATPSAWPWQTDVIINNYTGCGGSLIGPGWVATAGHCCSQYGQRFPLQDYRLRFGYQNCKDKTDGQTMLVDQMFVHPRFTESSTGANYDYCLLKLKQTVTFGPKIQPVCLPRPLTMPVAGTACVATGCGNTVAWKGTQSGNVTIPDKLQVVNLNTVASSECVKAFHMLTPEMNCAFQSNKDTCQGDSGGPLVCKGPDFSTTQYQLVGITSYGFGCASGLPGVFADVPRLMPFLIKVLYQTQRWGWFSNTAVPTPPRRPDGGMYEPRVNKVLPPEQLDANESSAQPLLPSCTSINTIFPCLCILKLGYFTL
ncbi:serine protease hepsin-like isoform X2 [Paramacrobiotus metropolitanus]|uniref:serine protease hepsin-like isoform X2 n=1 Tax=Paramacrobiotus metropolitanus TaxID=2943436 RepID=UPI0024459F9F|nr:serine protease hepsin-like isoform X2 [Paramacrobiotus metropolitanus]